MTNTDSSKCLCQKDFLLLEIGPIRENLEEWERRYHNGLTNKCGVTHHIIDDRTHYCIFCGKLDQRGVIPFLHIMGDL